MLLNLFQMQTVQPTTDCLSCVIYSCIIVKYTRPSVIQPSFIRTLIYPKLVTTALLEYFEYKCMSIREFQQSSGYKCIDFSFTNN